ncbi:MAG: hypothetical protein K0R17_342 [Rariglobus sp.]|jgi:hypothetical protein|nr:hypothetical protein [Rariglobus sp.]
MKKAVILSATFGGLLAVATAWHVITDVRGVSSSKRSTQASMPFLQVGLRLCVQEYGALPEATENSTLFKILTGANPRKLRFCSATEAEHAAGQFLDGWERPYVFQKTAGNLIILSAGSDGIHYTKDDLTLETLVP